MTFNLYNSTLEVVATIDALDIDAAIDLFTNETLQCGATYDCVSDHIAIIESDKGTFAVCEEGYTPDADDLA